MYKRLLLCLLVMGCVAAYASSPTIIYVESNVQSQNGNAIIAFQHNSNGSVTAVPGSPFPTGGTGVQDTSLGVGPYESDQNIVIDKERKLLFAVNSGSDTIAVFHVNDNG